jgi:hypothetical protein
MSLKVIDRRISEFMARWGTFAVRLSFGVIFIWFGILKPFGHPLPLRVRYPVPELAATARSRGQGLGPVIQVPPVLAVERAAADTELIEHPLHRQVRPLDQPDDLQLL